MSADLKALVAEVDALMGALSERDRIAFELEKNKALLGERVQAHHEADVAGYPERVRAARHHEVLCLALKWALDHMTTTTAEIAQWARIVANDAYPPPKQCALVNCDKDWPHDHPVSGPHCTPPKDEP